MRTNDLSRLHEIESEFLLFKESNIHGRGGFAKINFQNGACVIEYVGERIDKRESQHRSAHNNEYLFALNKDLDLDGNVPWNPARFLNHSCDPNCEAVLEDERIWIISKRFITQGEEITFNYGYDLEDYRKFPCRCGASGCVGFIVAEAFFDHVRAQNQLRSHSA